MKSLTFHRFRFPFSSRRAGISLLEIMISIGVVGIGLIGVASLIPLAHFKASQGVREERKSLFGKRAVREFYVRELDRPGTLDAPYWLHIGLGAIGSIHMPLGERKIFAQTYCFDPHWVANGFQLNQMGISTGAFHFFPANTSMNIHVPRLTLLKMRPERIQQSIVQRNPAQQALAIAQRKSFVNASPPLLIDVSQADSMFRIQDDLVVEQPENPNDIVHQTYLTEANGTPLGLPTKVVTNGSFSWMATLVPEPRVDRVQGPHLANRYVASFLIFHQRDMSGAFREEVVAEVNPNESVFSGPIKEIVIDEIGADSHTPGQPIPGHVGVRDIRRGNWIALMQNQHPVGTIPYNPATQPNVMQLKWYQVVNADELDGDYDLRRELTLTGPDWTPNPSRRVFAVYLRNVETVYEKTVELKTD
ncbi:MAG: hypothetical protein CMJ80_15045 [Planctomycetaceae bacterium]|nr:hypothetical protein [Planctomycetaceae bacterium]